MGGDWINNPIFINTAGSALGAIIVGILLFLVGIPQGIWRRLRDHPKSVLRRIYRQAGREAALSSQVQRHVLAIIEQREYFDEHALKVNVSRGVQLDQFRRLLAARDPALPAEQIAGTFYDAVYDGLAKSPVDFCRETARRWERERAAEPESEGKAVAQAEEAQRRGTPPNVPGYYAIVLTDQPNFAQGITDEAGNCFARLPAPVTPLGPEPLVHVGRAETDDWQLMLEAALDRFTDLKKQRREVHLVCAAPWLWCYALGTRLQDHYDLVLYHYQAHTYHRIWHMSREVKDRKSLREGKQYAYSVCGGPTQSNRPTRGVRNDAAVLALNLGSHLDSVVGHCSQRLPGVPVWTMRLKDDLLPSRPDDWVRAAADVAYAIDWLAEGRGDTHIYLYGILPAVLGLMVGSAVGPYRHIHLMQFAGGGYGEMLDLPPRT